VLYLLAGGDEYVVLFAINLVSQSGDIHVVLHEEFALEGQMVQKSSRPT